MLVHNLASDPNRLRFNMNSLNKSSITIGVKETKKSNDATDVAVVQLELILKLYVHPEYTSQGSATVHPKLSKDRSRNNLISHHRYTHPSTVTTHQTAYAVARF
jgi:hypothetical protein